MDVTVNASKFNDYTKKLATALKADLPDVIKSEAASVLKIAANRTGVAKATEVREQTRVRVMKRMSNGSGLITVNIKRNRGRVWYQPSESRQWQIIGTYPFRGKRLIRNGWKIDKSDWLEARKLWAEQGSKLPHEIRMALESRGLTAKSWLDVIQTLGFSPLAVPPRGPKRVTNAINAKPRRGPRRMNGASSSSGDGTSRFVLMVQNLSPLAVRNNGKSVLSGAIRTRAAAFRNAAFQSAPP